MKKIVCCLLLVFSIIIFASEITIVHKRTCSMDHLFRSSCIELGDTLLYRDLPSEFAVIGSSVRTENSIYIAMSKHGPVESYLTGTQILATYDGIAVFSADPETVHGIMQLQSKDFRLRPARFGDVIIRTEPAIPKIRARKDITDLVGEIKLERAMELLEKLVAYKTRYTRASNHKQLVSDMKVFFEELGYESSLTEFTIGSGTYYNVRAGKKGTSDRMILVTGHLDSISEDSSNHAPGADDNGSGSVGVLLAAELLKDVELDCTIEFILFNGEEQGLYGSSDYVKDDAVKDRIAGVVNMDMIGYCGSNPNKVLLETEQIGKDLVEGIAASFTNYSGLETVISYYAWGSDHEPFLDADIPAVLCIEKDWSQSPGYHSTRDTIDVIKKDYFLKMLKGCIASVVELAGLK